MADKDMARRLIEARERQGRYKDATEAARALRMRPSTYLGHENGSRGFRRWAAKYARFYKVRLEWLLEGAGSMYPGAQEAILLELTPEERVQVDNFIGFLRQRRPQD